MRTIRMMVAVLFLAFSAFAGFAFAGQQSTGKQDLHKQGTMSGSQSKQDSYGSSYDRNQKSDQGSSSFDRNESNQGSMSSGTQSKDQTYAWNRRGGERHEGRDMLLAWGDRDRGERGGERGERLL